MQVLFIDSRVPDAQVFIDSVNDQTVPIVYTQTPEIPEGPIDRIGFVFILGSPQWFGTGPEQEETMVRIIRDHSVRHIDFLACNTLQDPSWTAYYARLTEQTGVIVGASNDRTGNLKYGGDWTMESTGQDIEQVYFTKTIEYYKYLLDNTGVAAIILTKDGKLIGRGENTNSKLGISENVEIETLIQIGNHTGVTSVKTSSSDYNYTLFISEGKLYGMGSHAYDGVGGIHPIAQIGNYDQVTLIECHQYYALFVNNNHLYVMGDFNYPNKIFTHVLTTPINDLGYFPNITKIIATLYNSYFISDGKLYVIGNNTYVGGLTASSTSITQIGNYSKVTNIECNNSYVYYNSAVTDNLPSIVFIDDDKIYVAGDNRAGQLGQTFGIGLNNTFLPVTELGVYPNVTKVICMPYCTIFISNGKLYGMGFDNGQMGISQGNIVPITQIGSYSNVTHVDCSISIEPYTLYTAFINDGKLYGMGSNRYGQLGVQNVNYNDIFGINQYRNYENVTDCICMGRYAIFVSNNVTYKTVYRTNPNSSLPTLATDIIQIDCPYPITKITKSYYYHAALLFISNGKLYGMGNNEHGQLSLPLNPIFSDFVTIENDKKVLTFGVAYKCTFFATNDQLYQVGVGNPIKGYENNNSGPITKLLGNYPNVTRITTTDMTSGSTLFISDGLLYGLGYNGYGELGPSFNVYPIGIKQIGNYKNVTKLDSGDGFTVFVSDGKLYGMGKNTNGQLGPSVNGITQIGNYTNITKLSCGFTFTIFVSDGKLYGMGDNTYGQLGPNGQLGPSVNGITQIGNYTNITKLSCGGFHTMFVSDGKLYGMGDNYNGQLGPTVNGITQIGNYTNVTQLITGPHTYFVNNGILYGMGNNSRGQITSPASNIAPITEIMSPFDGFISTVDFPIILKLNPNHALSGTPITLEGYELQNTSFITFGNTTINSFTINASGYVNCVTPVGSGNASVGITDINGYTTNIKTFTYDLDTSIIQARQKAAESVQICNDINHDMQEVYLLSGTARLKLSDYNFMSGQVTTFQYVQLAETAAINASNALKRWPNDSYLSSIVTTANQKWLQTIQAQTTLTTNLSNMSTAFSRVTFIENRAVQIETDIIIKSNNAETDSNLLDTASTQELPNLINRINEIRTDIGNASSEFYTLVQELRPIPDQLDDYYLNAMNAETDMITFQDEAETASLEAVAVAAAYDRQLHSIHEYIVPILDSSGNLYTVGINNYGQSGMDNILYQNALTFNVSNVSSVGTTRYGMIYLQNDQLYFSGKNQYGELGNNIPLSTNSTLSIPNIDIPNITQFSAGLDHTLLIDNLNNAYAMGLNNYGQLGKGDTVDSSIPRQLKDGNFVDSPFKCTQVATGLSHSAFLTTDHKAYTFGRNQYGQLGTNNQIDSTSPIYIRADVTQIACGANHTLFLSEEKVYACGNNASGQLGLNLQVTQAITPTLIPGLSQIVSISAGGDRSAALDIGGNLWVWGPNLSPSIQKTQVSYVNVTYMGIFYVSNNQYNVMYSQLPVLPDGPLRFGSPSVPLFRIQSNICFPADTQIQTDQGLVAIQTLVPGTIHGKTKRGHTIGGKPIVAITETYSSDSELVVLEKDALFSRYPSQRTVITREHKIFYECGWVEAYKFLNMDQAKENMTIYTIPYTGEPLYNVLLEQHGRMKVNNLIVETLDPNNMIGKIFKKYQEELHME
jgi:alpha-tubulin suppressor-like RCC1 family protein